MLKEFNCDDIYIRHAIDTTPVSGSFTMHVHERCEIYFFISGDVEYLVEGSRYPLTEPCLIIMRPAEAHTPQLMSSATYERYAINFPVNFAAAIDPELRLLNAFLNRPLGQNNRLNSTTLDVEAIRAIFARMCKDYDDEYEQCLAVKANLITLLDIINRAYKASEYSDYKPQNISERIVAYVNKHLFEQLSIPVLAEHFYLSASQFSRIFKRATGAAPWDYITIKRLTAAKEKIRNGALAQDAAQHCGFSDYSTFYRAYVKHFGMAPTNS